MCMRFASLAAALLFANAAFAADDIAVDVQNASDADALRRGRQRLRQARIAGGSPVQGRGGASELHRHHRGRPLGLRPAQLPRAQGRAVHHRTAAPHHDLRRREVAAHRHHDSELLAQDRRAGARRRQERERRATAAALDARERPRRGSAGALSAGRLLARAPAAAEEPLLERLRLVVPRRADRDEGAADRRHQGSGVRPGDQDVPPAVHARRQRDAAAREARHRAARCST